MAGGRSTKDLPFGMLSSSTGIRHNRSVTPTVTLVLGDDKNVVRFDTREIKLTKWDRYLFAQGVVMLAFEDLMMDHRTAMAQRAVTWVDATVDVERLTK